MRISMTARLGASDAAAQKEHDVLVREKVIASKEERNAILEQMTDNVSELVLEDNRHQARAITLAVGQGLCYVLAMVVVGGLVGAGALGYDVVLGFSRSEEWGKGAAAGISIVLLGVMVDRVCRAAADRSGQLPDQR